MATARIVTLVGARDGVNKTFTSPVAFLAGTIRVIWNGVTYSADDARKGWTETNATTIQTTLAPRADDELEAFIQEATNDDVTGVAGVVGSPHHPSGALP